MKDLEKVKTIIRWQINWDTVSEMIKISQSAFIRDLIIEEELTKCNTNVISMKTASAIKMTELEDYEEVNFHT